jgi:MarR family transcriptional regulator, organic hydroperoxide resistance regulator
MNTNNLLKLENQLCFSAYTASRLITKLYRPFLEQIGITYPQYLVMLVLWEEEGITLKDLGNRLYLDSGTLTPLLKRLEALKLINRERSSEDERLLCVTITNEGRLLKEKAKLIPECLLSSINIDTTELIQLKKGLDNLINSFEK